MTSEEARNKVVRPRKEAQTEREITCFSFSRFLCVVGVIFFSLETRGPAVEEMKI